MTRGGLREEAPGTHSWEEHQDPKQSASVAHKARAGGRGSMRSDTMQIEIPATGRNLSNSLCGGSDYTLVLGPHNAVTEEVLCFVCFFKSTSGGK